MKAIILARVSTEEQKEAGNSLPAQVVRGKNYCKQKGFTVVETFSFDESAYKVKRDAFDEILDFIGSCKEKVTVCFDKVDRFSRNIFDKRVAALYDLAMADKIELHFVSDNLVINKDISATEKFHFGINLGLAKYYSDAISDNTKRAFEQKWRKGEWTGQARLGYKNIIDENDNRDFVVDTDSSHLVKKMFELYATGQYSAKKLQKKMKELGLKSRNGKEVVPSLIHRMLRDKFYIGIMSPKGIEKPHKYPPIVPKPLFDKVQSILDSHNKKPFKINSKPFTLKGLIKCDKCGCAISPEVQKGKYIYYSCSNYKGKCKRLFVKEEDLLKPILKAMRKMKLPQQKRDETLEDLKKMNESKNHFHERMIGNIQKDYNGIQTKLDKLLDLLVDECITQSEYDNKVKQFKERQYELNQDLEQYTQADENFHVTASMVFSLASRSLEIFESSEVNEKRQFLEYLLTNCRLSGRNLLFKLQSPFDTILEVADEPINLPGSDSNRRPID